MDRIKEIILEFKEKNYSSFDEFYDSTKRLIYLTIKNIINDKQTTEDLMQDTYMKYLENINKVSINQNPVSYLCTIAHNLSINYYNRKKKERLDNDYFDTLIEEKDNYIDLGVLDYLDKDVKEIVFMHIIGDLKFKDIAKITNKPLGTILWLYNKGIKILKKKVGEENE